LIKYGAQGNPQSGQGGGTQQLNPSGPQSGSNVGPSPSSSGPPVPRALRGGGTGYRPKSKTTQLLMQLSQQVSQLQQQLTQLQQPQPPQPPEPPAPPQPPQQQQSTVSTQQQIVDLLNAFRETFSSEKGYRGTTKEDIKQQLRTALEDAQVKDILNIIDAQAFVTKLVATDDNLAAYDPEDVFEAYTFLYSIAPNALQNEVVASAFIQKYLAQGKTIDPYDVRQLASIEQGLQGKGSVA